MTEILFTILINKKPISSYKTYCQYCGVIIKSPTCENDFEMYCSNCIKSGNELNG